MANIPFNPLNKLPGDKKNARAEINGTPRALNLPQKAIVNNIAFSETEAWAFYSMSSTQFDFESIDTKALLIHQASEAYAAILNLGGNGSPVHIMPFTLPSYADPNAFLATSYNHAQALSNPMYDEIMKVQAEVIKDARVPQQNSYIGVMLGDRKTFQQTSRTEDIAEVEETPDEAFELFKEGIVEGQEEILQMLQLMLGAQTEHVSALEEANAKAREATIRRALSYSALSCKPVTSEELMLITKTMLHPAAIGVPPIEIDTHNRIGSQELAYEYVHLIDNSHNKCLAITQEYEGGSEKMYVATFTITQLPEVLEFPQMTPFSEVVNYALPQARIFAKLSIAPAALMKEAFGHKKIEHINEARETEKSDETIQQYGHSTIDDLQRIHQRTLALEAENDRIGTPWVVGTIHITVAAEKYEDLERAYETLRQECRNQNITLGWTRYNQVELFLSGIPGAGTLVRGKHNAHALTQAFTGYLGINFTAAIGDDINPNALANSTAPRI